MHPKNIENEFERIAEREPSAGSRLCNLRVTVSRAGCQRTHRVVMLAGSDEEISDKLQRWLKLSRKGSRIVSWERIERREACRMRPA